jgi:hypothetical protein
VKLLESQRDRQRLDRLVVIAQAQHDPEVQALLTQYLCVQVAGFLEQSTFRIFFEHSRARSQATVSSFVSRRLARPTNYNVERILQLAGQFDANFRRAIEAALTDEQRGPWGASTRTETKSLTVSR